MCCEASWAHTVLLFLWRFCDAHKALILEQRTWCSPLRLESSHFPLELYWVIAQVLPQVSNNRRGKQTQENVTFFKHAWVWLWNLSCPWRKGRLLGQNEGFKDGDDYSNPISQSERTRKNPLLARISARRRGSSIRDGWDEKVEGTALAAGQER